jgi:hypothetical protein
MSAYQDLNQGIQVSTLSSEKGEARPNSAQARQDSPNSDNQGSNVIEHTLSITMSYPRVRGREGGGSGRDLRGRQEASLDSW